MLWWYRFIGWLNPRPYFWRRPFRPEIELYRCHVDRRLLTLGMMRTGLCAGHRIGQPAYPTVTEILFLWLGIIR